MLAVGAGGGCLDIFSLIYQFSFVSPSLWETARYRLKYCLKGPLSSKQPTNQPSKHKNNAIYIARISGTKDCLVLYIIMNPYVEGVILLERVLN